MVCFARVATALALIVVVTLVSLASANPGSPPSLPDNSLTNEVKRPESLTSANIEQAAPALFQEIEALSLHARLTAHAILEKTSIPVGSAQSIHADSTGHLFYADHFPNDDGKRRRRSEEDTAEKYERIRRYVVDNPPSGEGSNGIPYYHSRPNAVAKLYLDFDGHVNPSSSAWGAFSAKAFSRDSDYTTFNEQEVLDIIEIWRLVSEDFAPFQIDVTTERPAGFQRTTHLHALITEDRQTNGNTMPAYGAGGVAYVGVYDDPSITYYSPALIYQDSGSSISSINLIISHEIGHNLGLSHDGDDKGEYNSAYTAGATSETTWGPIMGAPYGAAIVQWSNGEYPFATNTENDYQIIGGQTGFAADEAGGDAASSAGMTVTDNQDGTYTFEAKGIIGSRTDKDWYHLNFVSNGVLDISASPWYANGNSIFGNNLDIQLTIYDSSLTQVARNSPGGTAAASLMSIPVSAGTYYIEIDGVGSPVVASDYGSMGHYTITGTANVNAATQSTVAPTVATSTFTTQDTTQPPTTTTTTTPCVEDQFEPNNDLGAASELASVGEATLTICPSDEDLFVFDGCSGVIDIYLTFSHSAGDIDSYVLNANGAIVDSSLSGSDNEHLQVSGTGVYYLYVYGYQGATNDYQIAYTTDCGTTRDTTTPTTTTTADSGTCVDDGYEPNDSFEYATNANPGILALQTLAACTNNNDYYRVAICAPGQHITFAVYFSHAQGDVDIKLYDPFGNSIDQSTSVTDNEYLEFTSNDEAYVYLRVYGWNGEENTYQVLICGTGCGSSPPECDDITTTPFVDTTTSSYTHTTTPFVDTTTTSTIFVDTTTTTTTPVDTVDPTSPTTPTTTPVGTTTTDPCEGTVYFKRDRWCANYCNGPYNFYRDAEEAGFVGCHRKHCECITDVTTIADPCAGTNFVSKERWCSNQCDGLYTFYRSAEDAGFPGCTRKHCQCEDPTTAPTGPTTADPCEGINYVRKWRWCSNQCGGNYNFYRDAEEAGFIGCHMKHCECL